MHASGDTSYINTTHKNLWHLSPKVLF